MAKKGATTSKNGNGAALVIVESPAKSRTINKYLGSDYVVKASMGHVRDLPRREYGIDIARGFEPTYELVATRKKVLDELRKYAQKAPMVYLATDLDREGEAIAWHLAKALDLPEERIRRVIFNEITESAIRHAFEHPHSIDLDKVNAQQARRVLDRIVGYELSPLLWRKVAKGLSAGRVQSVAAKLIVDREREIRRFVPEESWKIAVVFSPDAARLDKLTAGWKHFAETTSESGDGPTQKSQIKWLSDHGCFKADLVRFDGREFAPRSVADARPVAEALGFAVERVSEQAWDEYREKGLHQVELVGRLAGGKSPQYTVVQVQTKRTTSRPTAPFTTATLQQAAATQLRFTAQRTMRLAQELYEGVDLSDGEGPVGLITYMRTDSTNLSRESVTAAREQIAQQFGDRYVPAKPNVYGTKGRAQEAHEAIRATVASRTPESIRGHLSADLFKLYDLIWRRFIACQMTPAEWDSTTVTIEAQTPRGKAELRAGGRVLVFDGFLKVAGASSDGKDPLLPALRDGQPVHALSVEPRQTFSSPPPRFNEASLVKALEAEGIGRPSTYAQIIQTIQDRGYVELADRKFFATSLGEVVTDLLAAHFPQVMDTKFTAFMEDELDKIEEQHKDWVEVLHEFYDPFRESLAGAMENMERVGAQESEYTCDKCGRPMVYRWSKSGRFLSCTGYPECKETINVDRDGRPQRVETTEHKCELCGKPMMLRRSRRGAFLGCSGYPECNGTIPCDESGQPLRLVTEEELRRPCEQCGEPMVVKWKGVRAFLGCSAYPACKATQPLPEGVRLPRPKIDPPEKAGVNCPKCGREMVIRKGRRGKFVSCSGYPRCRNAVDLSKLDELKAQAAQGGAPAATGSGGTNGAPGKPLARRSGAKATKSAGGATATAPTEAPPGFAMTRTGKICVETWPQETLHCPECGSEMTLRQGRFGPFFSCTGFPRCKVSANLRGEAKKRAEAESPRPDRPKPIPTDIACSECGEKMLIRTGRSGQFLGCSAYPRCRATQPLPAELVNSMASLSPS